VEFRILGPLELVGGADGVSLDAPKLRALLGVLLLHPNEVVSSERLIDELWGERPPATAGKVVQTYVSQLRRGLDPDAIATRPPGYVLRVGSGELDADRFHRLAAEARQLAASGDHARARRLYSEALALWRGPPLAGVVFESFARNEVEQLGEERLGALMDLIDCELALGNHAEVVAELETLVRQHPLRERLRAQLMLALYRCGRQADALAAYRDARRTLVEELGLEPGPELQQLEKAILAHDTELRAPARPRPAAGILARRPRRTPALVLGALLLLIAIALGLVFGLPRDHPASITLAPNSVGFIDAASGRVTKSFPAAGAPSSLAMTKGFVWIANEDDETLTRIDTTTGRSIAIPVRGHPTGLAAAAGRLWAWTLEDSLVPIDPRFDTAGTPVPLAAKVVGARTGGGRIAVGDGFVWLAAPLTTILRIDPSDPRHARPIVPDGGVQGALAYHDGKLWVAGADQVFPVTATTGIPGAGARVGVVRDLAFGAGSLWVASGGPGHVGGIVQALRRVDPHSRLVQATIAVGSDPVAVAAAGGSIWVASRTDGMVERVDPARNRVVETIAVGAKPVALAAAGNGVWVAAR
jgi:DNA-binding SARP family transcriptional activator/DNA-binding beta-propeller fold protein YncE